MSSNSRQLVSVIVPAYNVSNYIKKCIDSILNQTYKDIEIIVVDDGSTDDTGNIIKNNYLSDRRIRYFKKKNGGLSSARNYGILNSKGKYLCFVDSDDWISKTFVSEMLSAIKHDNTDIAICNMCYTFSDGKIKKRTPKIRRSETLSANSAFKELMNGSLYKAHAQNKMFKRSLFIDNNILFPIGKIYEDVFTTYRLIINAKKVSLINDFLYFYLQERQGSILNNRFNIQRFDIMDALNQIRLTVSEEEKDYFQKFYITNVISLVNYIYPIFDSTSTGEIQEYKELLLKNSHLDIYNRNFWKNPKLSLVEKTRFSILTKDFRFYCHLMNLVNLIRKKM